MTTPGTPVPHSRGRRAGRGDEGQAVVELALVLPLVFLLLLAIVQVGFVIRDQVLAVHAAREAAREAAVSPEPERARQAALAGSGLAADRLRVDVDRGPAGGRARVVVHYRSPTDIPLVGPMVPDVDLTAGATMRVEG